MKSLLRLETDRTTSPARNCGILILRSILAIAAILLALRILLCQILGCDGPTLLPRPDIPTELSSLPSRGHVKCSQNSDPSHPGSSGWYVWEHPGITPENLDTNSPYTGYRGKLLGIVRDCVDVKVVDFAWSEVDGEFWLWIESVPMIERASGDSFKVHPETWLMVELEPTVGWVLYDAIQLDNDVSQ